MISNQFDLDFVKTQPNYTVLRFKDSVYRGQYKKIGKEKIRHGYGIMVYKQTITVNAQKNNL